MNTFLFLVGVGNDLQGGDPNVTIKKLETTEEKF